MSFTYLSPHTLASFIRLQAYKRAWGTKLLTHAPAVAIRNKVSFTICTIVIVVQQYSVSRGIWVHVHVHSEKADECMLSGPHTIIIFI